MSSVALALVLLAAVIHPTWNLLAKRATDGDAIAFVWLTSALSTAFYVPFVVALVLVGHVRLPGGPVYFAMIVGTGVLHVIYFALLQRGYRASEFTLVYPLARGSAPIFAASVAIALFDERLDLVQCAGIVLVVLAIVVITRRSADGRATVATSATHATRTSLGYGLATGLAIAAYTLWDKQAVSAFAISPILYDFGRTAAQAAILAPAVFRSDARRTSLRSTWTAAPRPRRRGRCPRRGHRIRARRGGDPARIAAPQHRRPGLPRAAGERRERTGRAHDGDGKRHQERGRSHQGADA